MRVKTMFKGLKGAILMYSKLPLPLKWEEDCKKYSLCFFPVVGIIIGFMSVFAFMAMEMLKWGDILKASVLTILPVIISGGIHTDGFIDTIDGLCSYKSEKERLEILKDPHTGAFAVIYAVVYFVAVLGFFSEAGIRECVFSALGYVYSRALSGWSVVNLKTAKSDGMAADSAKRAASKVKNIMWAEIIVCIIAFIALDAVVGSMCAIGGILWLLWYKRIVYRAFGGVTGDTSGYFLQICELVILIAAVAMKGWGV